MRVWCALAAKFIHETIAQMMIFANSTVAEFIYTTFRDRALLRRHEDPEASNFGELKATAAAKVRGWVGVYMCRHWACSVWCARVATLGCRGCLALR